MVTSFLGSATLLPAALSLFKPAFIFPGKEAGTEDISPAEPIEVEHLPPR
jgi:hypothetical protein